jgi:hypothetical protein
MELDETEPEKLLVEVGEMDVLALALKTELGLAIVGVRAEEGEADSVEEREPLLELEEHAEEVEVTVPHLEGPADLEEVIVVVVVFVEEVEPVGETETVLVLELVCVAEFVEEMELEPEAELV